VAWTERSDTADVELGEILDLVSEGIVVLDSSGEVTYRSAVAERLMGTGPASALADDAIEELALSVLRNGSVQERRLELAIPSRRDLLIRAYPVGDGRVVAVIEDVSERQRLESVRRDFVANVSHELKTPVGALSLLAEALDGEDDPEVVVRLAARIGQESDRLVRIIDDLLDLSRIEGRLAVEPDTVPIAAVIRESIELIAPAAASLGVVLHFDEPPVAFMRGDRRDLVSALSNLIDNAVKYSEPGGTVTVTCGVEEGRVILAVADTGVGIPARDLERIFERFYRVDRARSRLTGGTGLGLSIVRHVVANHGGTVNVESVEGEGSTFTLSFPLTGEVEGIAGT
jgi:two-component system sensor histidine kinase SenX3